MFVPAETKERVEELLETYLPELSRFEPFWPRAWARMPAVDLTDRGEYLLLTAEMPGIKKDHVDITILDSKITIKGTLAKSDPDEVGHSLIKERLRGDFVRTVRLPVSVDAASAGARLESGLLTVKLPKRADAMPRRLKVRTLETEP